MKKNLLLLLLSLQSIPSMSSDSVVSLAHASGAPSISGMSVVSGITSKTIDSLGAQLDALNQAVLFCSEEEDVFVRVERSDTNITRREECISASGFRLVSEGSEKSFRLPQPPIPRVGGQKLIITSSDPRAAVVLYKNWFPAGKGFALLGRSMHELPKISDRSAELRRK